MEDLKPYLEIGGLIVGIPGVIGLFIGIVRWFMSIHAIGTSINSKMDDFLMQISEQKRENLHTRKIVKKHERVLVEHGARLDNHGNKITMLEKAT